MAANLLSGLVQGFAQSREKKKEKDLIEEFKKTQKKLLDAQVDATVTKAEAQKRLSSMLSGMEPATPNMETGESIGPPQQVPKRKLTEILADPESAMLAIQSGLFTGQDVLAAQRNQGIMEAVGGSPGRGPSGLELSGLKFDTQGNPLLDFSQPKITTQVVDTPDGPRIQTFNQRTGERIADLGEPKAEKFTAEQAGKIAMLDQAVSDIDLGVEILFPSGKLDQNVLLQMAAPGGGLGRGRTARSLFRNAMNAKLRAETGAQANPDELDDMEKRFLPSPLDLSSPGLPELKVKRLKEFMESTIDISTLPRSLQEKVRKRGGGSNEVDIDLTK